MGIKGLTDRNDNPTAGLIEIARLYKGDEKPQDGKRPGKDLTYFRVEFAPEHESARATWEELYGKEPTEFSNVFLAGNSADEAFSAWNEEWNGSGTLLHRCDGETQVRWWNASAGVYSTSRIACSTRCECKETGRLKLIMPELWDVLGIPCYVSVTTHSKYDIIALDSHLRMIERMYGVLWGVPFVFGRALREVSIPNPQQVGKRMKVNKSLLYLRVTSDFTQKRLLPLLSAQAALPTGESDAPLLGDGQDSAIEDGSYDNPARLFTCSLLLVLPTKNGFQYVAKTDEAENLVSFERKPYRDSGLFSAETLDGWKVNVPQGGKKVELFPPVRIEARMTDSGWDILKVLSLADAPPPPSDLSDIPF